VTGRAFVHGYLSAAKTFIIMQQPDKLSSRKKFLIWGTAVLTSLTAFKLFAGSKKLPGSPEGEKKKTVKMLTRDGKLVEVHVEQLYCGKRKKISDEQLKNWVVKKKSNTTG
jgi:hypothetical protein